MLYFSQLKGKKIMVDENGALGTLWDILFLGSKSPLVTKVAIKNLHGGIKYVPVQSIQQVNGVLKIAKDYELQPKEENELSVMKNVMDRQIIDIKGSKVVRVNDVAIQDKIGASWYVAGVDIGIQGILSWLGIEGLTLPLYRLTGTESHPHFLAWSDFEPLELEKGKVQLKKDVESLERMRPEDLADYLEKTNIRNIDKVVTSLDEEYAADVIEDLNANFQTAIFRRFSGERAAKLIELIDPDDAVDILLTLPKDKRKEILDAVSEKKRKKLQSLLKLSDTPIGELVTTEYLSVSAQMTVKQATEVIKEKASDMQFTSYIYVLNEEANLVGVVKLSDLFKQNQDAVIANFMEQDIIVVHLTTPLDIAIKRMLRYKLYALPVVDNSKHMHGIITFDDTAEDILEKI